MKNWKSRHVISSLIIAAISFSAFLSLGSILPLAHANSISVGIDPQDCGYGPQYDCRAYADCTYYAGCDINGLQTHTWYFQYTVCVNGYSGTANIGYSVNHYGGPNISGPTSASVSDGSCTTFYMEITTGGATSGVYGWTLSASVPGMSAQIQYGIYYSYCRSCL